MCSADAGVYTCQVANSAGKASVTAELIAQGNTEGYRLIEKQIRMSSNFSRGLNKKNCSLLQSVL